MTSKQPIVREDGTKEWFYRRRLHRLDGPARERPDGTKEWYMNGKHHRLDGPAIIKSDGNKAWFKEGVLHREDGPAIEYTNGSNYWFYYGGFYRVGGPAVDNLETKIWYLSGTETTEERYNNVMRLCKKFIVKIKTNLRKKYINVLRETNTCDEIWLYNLISEYMI